MSRSTPQSRATTAFKRWASHASLYEVPDRRGRLWIGCMYGIVRADLLEVDRLGLDDRPSTVALLKSHLRDCLAMDSLPTRSYANDWVTGDGLTVRRFTVEVGPWYGVGTHAVSNPTRTAQEAALHVHGGSWTWHMTGCLKPIVLRRDADRMAVAVVMPVRVDREWVGLVPAEVTS